MASRGLKLQCSRLVMLADLPHPTPSKIFTCLENSKNQLKHIELSQDFKYRILSAELWR
jgi:hypothetical protein